MGAKKLILMSGRFILDTNIIIAIFSGETSIKEHLLKAELRIIRKSNKEKDIIGLQEIFS